MKLTFDFLFEQKLRVYRHLLFWIAVLVFYTLFFGQQGGDYVRTLYFAGPLMMVTIATTWFINYFLFPRFLATGRYLQLLGYSLLTVIVSVWLETVTVSLLLLLQIYSGKSMPSHATLNLSFLVVAMYFVIFFAVAVKLLQFWYKKQTQLQKVARDKLEAELKLLKSQIHPHFLFNTLNNIYALALRKSDAAPEMILKLSEILDYLLYECDVSLVPLEKELLLLENYIALERIRYAGRLDLSFEVEGEVADIEIAPLILLPFVENSFKHGAGKKREGVYIRIRLAVAEDHLAFTVDNNKPADPGVMVHGGLGLENIRKRLELLYPGKHRLQVEDNADTFSVNLTIDRS